MDFYIKGPWIGLPLEHFPASLAGWLWLLENLSNDLSKKCETKVTKCKSKCVQFCFHLPIIMAYFVLPKSSCIRWEIGMILLWYLEISQCVLEISLWQRFPNQNLRCPFSMLSFIRYFLFAICNCICSKNVLWKFYFSPFHNLMLLENLSVCLAQISVKRFQNKNLICIFLHFPFWLSWV